ncbi:MAG: ABC transporter ATP-binding protein [Alphaproteobacteria bacterium]|nr:ABC transporter ATP-binding protein [Alphaproteobacteria bacterium]
MSEPVLQIENLTKRFGALIANDAVSLDVLQGELHAVIGPNGAGKTTLVSQLGGELAPNEGRIVFNGRDITQAPVHERALMGLSRSYQITSVIPSFTALDNVALAAQAIDGHSYRFWRPARAARHLNDKSAAILEEIGLGARMSVLARNMSHGEHRLLEIAMALATDPTLLLLDEPTAGMGPAATEEMIGFLRTLKTRHAILLVEHDMDVVFSLADRISVLVNGGRIATDVPEKIRADKQVRRAYLGDKADALTTGEKSR